jgi:hypothetical protein
MTIANIVRFIICIYTLSCLVYFPVKQYSTKKYGPDPRGLRRYLGGKSYRLD